MRTNVMKCNIIYHTSIAYYKPVIACLYSIFLFPLSYICCFYLCLQDTQTLINTGIMKSYV